MAFDASKFEQAKLAPRTEMVNIPELAAFFDDGEACNFIVRGLSGPEMFTALEAEKKHAGLEKLLLAAADGGAKAVIDALREAVGIPRGTPGEMAKRLEMLVAGSVEPKLDLAAAVKLGTSYPVDFSRLTTTIIALTGMGYDVVKPAAASQTTPSSTQV